MYYLQERYENLFSGCIAKLRAQYLKNCPPKQDQDDQKYHEYRKIATRILATGATQGTVVFCLRLVGGTAAQFTISKPKPPILKPALTAAGEAAISGINTGAFDEILLKVRGPKCGRSNALLSGFFAGAFEARKEGLTKLIVAGSRNAATAFILQTFLGTTDDYEETYGGEKYGA